MGSPRVGQDCATSLSLFTSMHWRRKRQSTPVFLPGESQGWGSLVGCHLWVAQTRTRLKRLSSSSSSSKLLSFRTCYMLFSSFQFSCSVVSYSLRPHEPQHPRPPLPITNSVSPPKPMSIVSVMSSNHHILCCPLLLLPSIFPSIRIFSNESALRIRWPKYWSFSFNISPSNEHPGLISFRMDWLDLLAVQGTLKSLLQHTVQKHQFFCAQLSL